MTAGEASITATSQTAAAEYTPAKLAKVWVGAVAQSQELYLAAFDSWAYVAEPSKTWTQALTLAQRIAEQQVNPARSFRRMQALSDALDVPAAIGRAMLSATLEQTGAAINTAMQPLGPPDERSAAA